MRSPINQVLKNYRELNKFIREINPVEAFYKKRRKDNGRI